MDFKKVLGLAIIAVLAFVAVASVATTIDVNGSNHRAFAIQSNSGFGSFSQGTVQSSNRCC